MSQRLACDREGFAVHILVVEREPEKVEALITVAGAGERMQCRIQNVGEIRERGGARRQVEIPARVVRHVARVVPAIAVRQVRRCQRVIGTAPAQTPVLHEPADVADFPQERVDAREARRRDPLRIIEVCHERARILARILQRTRKLRAVQ